MKGRETNLGHCLSSESDSHGVVGGLRQFDREGVVVILHLARAAWQGLARSMSWESKISGLPLMSGAEVWGTFAEHISDL